MIDGTARHNRIRQWRRRRRLTLEELATRLETSATNLHRWETGKVAITLDRLAQIADRLGCSVVDLIAPERRVPVVGRIGAGAVVLAIDDHPLGRADRFVRCPDGLDAAKTVAVEVEGDSMLPIEEGWLLFYTRDYDGVPSECVGKLCVVQLADGGPRYVKRVKHGRQHGRFNLYSTNAREMEDIALAWAAPVLDARPRGGDDDAGPTTDFADG